jgi:pimeloyl-ACP methyl ester carboxylesterase
MAEATAESGAAAPAKPRRAVARAIWRGFLWLALVYGVAVVGGMQPSLPFDVVYTLGPAVPAGDAAPPVDGKRRLVVLQHGLWRSSWSLARIERSLRAAGYEVLNPDYPSTKARLQDHAARLHAEIEAAVRAGGPVDELYFVAHSLGGLVAEEYLRRHDARVPVACVYLAVPHRGAVLADLRKHWWVFQLVMGDQAAFELSPSDPFHEQAIPVPCPCGTIVGSRGEGNSSIPGEDDGTVAVGEATFAGATDSVVMQVGHTSIAVDREVIAQVLHFLRHHRFRPVAAPAKGG